MLAYIPAIGCNASVPIVFPYIRRHRQRLALLGLPCVSNFPRERREEGGSQLQAELLGVLGPRLQSIVVSDACGFRLVLPRVLSGAAGCVRRFSLGSFFLFFPFAVCMCIRESVPSCVFECLCLHACVHVRTCAAWKAESGSE